MSSRRPVVVVCIKQVPGTAEIKIDHETGTLIREGIPVVINPTDLNAVEEALRLKDACSARVVVMTMGPAQAEGALRDTLSMGADRAILLTDRAMAGADTYATSYTLSMAIKQVEKEEGAVGLVIFGKHALDGETGQVGTGVAARLGMPIVTYTSRLVKFDPVEGSVTATRNADEMVETVKVFTPAAVAVTETANKPRRASIQGILDARNVKVEFWDKTSISADPARMGLSGSPTMVKKMFIPEQRGRGKIFDGSGDPSAAAAWLMDKIFSSRPFSATSSAKTEKKDETVPRPVEPGTGSMQGNVWVYVEQNENRVAQVSWELMGVGSKLAKKLGVQLEAVVIGHNSDGLAREALDYGASKVYLIDDIVLKHYRAMPYAKGLTGLVSAHKPQVLLIGATRNGRDLAGLVATTVHTGLTADCTALDIDSSTGLMSQIRPTFGGSQLAMIMTPKHKPQMSTVRPGVFPKPEKTTGNGEIVTVETSQSEEETQVKILNFNWIEKSSLVQEADVVVSGGRGLGAAHFKLVKELAETLGGAVGASRKAVESGFADKESQIGQTGKTIRPKLYVAAAISGSIQHLVGIQGAETVIAVNLDPAAPIFNACNYGVIGDATKILPIVIASARQRREEAARV